MKLVLSLDMKNPLEFIEEYGSFEYVKAGHHLLSQGKSVLDELSRRGLKVIVDLKFADIPSIVAKAVKAWDHECVVGFTVHSAAGIDSVKAAMDSTEKHIFAVVKLTSMEGSLEDYMTVVEKLASIGSDFVLPGRWAKVLRERISGKILVPGIRMKVRPEDQKDVVTLDEIMEVADFAVLGREIYLSEDPKTKMEELREMIG